MTEPEVSVVCSTYQRSARLLLMLEALEKQTLDHDRFEVVVVDDGSTDGTAAALADFAKHSSLNLRPIIFEANQGRGPGREAGWRAARAPIVAFTDDDCAPAPEWLEAGVAAAQTGAAIVVGRTLPNPAQAHNAGIWSRSQAIGAKNGTLYFHTCNIFYRRADLEAVGGFDREFRAKGGEDTDLGWRVEARGGVAVFAEDALVFHDVVAGSFRSALREASKWIDIPRVTKKHRKRARPLLAYRLFWKPSHAYVVVALASVGVTVATRNVFWLAGLLPWVYYRLRKNPLWRGSKAQRIVYLPHAFVLDTVEVATMARGSVRHRVLVL
jgi:GT2 family glycosyltransferase